jgi:hypothetical protein
MVYLAALACVAAPAAAAPAKTGKPSPAKPGAKPAADPDVLSTGAEAILVDHLKPESPTVVLFYRPDQDADKSFLDGMRERAKEVARVGIRYVRLTSLDAPIAKQYEVDATPVAFVYDRNKNLLGKGRTLNQVGTLVAKGLRVARIKWVDESDPNAAQVYRMFGGGRQGAPEIMKTMSLRPEAMEMMAELTGRFHFSDGYLKRREHEMIAAYVSALNKCKY